MDPVTVSAIAVIAGFVAALIGSVSGSFLGPVVSARLERAGTLSAFVRDQRREAYTSFTVNVEEVQRLVDATAAEVAAEPYSVSDLEQLELSRVKIDLFGTHLAKIWAYRCTLSLIALAHVIGEGQNNEELLVLPRAKLHEARASLVRVIRYELGVSANEKDDRVSQIELVKTRDEIRKHGELVDSDGHHAWLDEIPLDPGAMSVSREAIAVYRQAAMVAKGITSGSMQPPGDA